MTSYTLETEAPTMFPRRKRERAHARSISTPCGLEIPFDAVLAVMSIDERSRPAVGIYPGQTASPALHSGGVVVVHQTETGEVRRTILEGTVPQLLARIAAVRI